jgi:hypothetical protein
MKGELRSERGMEGEKGNGEGRGMRRREIWGG